jgi:predicted nuclease of predicted toxin-antitoxin system
MKFKLDENLSPVLATLFSQAGHEAHSVVDQQLGGKPDQQVIDVCKHELRALVTLDLDFSNIHAYPLSEYPGIVVLRLTNQAYATTEAAIHRVLAPLAKENLSVRYG